MPKRDLKLARKAFKNKSVYDSVKAHLLTKVNDNQIKHNQEPEKYIKSLVCAGIYGIISTSAIVAGVSGASFSSDVLLILGIVLLFANGLSLSIGEFLSTKAESRYNRTERKREEWEIETYPDGEIREMIEIYTEKGITKADAESLTNIITKYKDAWVDIMMVEELGIVETNKSPFKSFLVSFFSFAFFGLIPLLPYSLLSNINYFQENTYIISIFMTGMALFLLGSLKIFITARNWFFSGVELVIVGGLAAFVAYGFGILLSGIV